MSVDIPILIAGTVGSGRQNHQADMWVPRLAQAGLSPIAVWTPPSVSAQHHETAAQLASNLGLELEVSPRPTRWGRGVVACLRGRERTAMLEAAAERGIPVLLDKPTVDTTAEIEAAAEAAADCRVVAGHHMSAHPGFTRALGAVRSGEIGLLRAVAADLVVSGGDGPSPAGELRNLGVYLIDMIRQATGPARLVVSAHSTSGDGAGDSWVMLGQSDHDVVVSAHVTRTAPGPGATLLDRIRLLGTHGWIVVDLLAPGLSVRTSRGHTAVPWGEDSVTALLSHFARVIRGEVDAQTLSSIVELSRALDEIEAAARTGRSRTLTW